MRDAEEYFANDVYERRSRMVPAYRTVTLSALVPRYVLEVAMFGVAAIIAAVAFSTDTVAGATATIGVFLAGGFRIIVPLNRVMFAVSQTAPPARRWSKSTTTSPTSLRTSRILLHQRSKDWSRGSASTT